MNDLENIYSAPKADLEIPVSEANYELATRGKRLAAVMLDGVIGMAFGIPFMVFIGPYIGYESGKPPSAQYLAISSIYGFIHFSLVHGYFLFKSGQTVGKKLLGIQILGLDNAKLPLVKILGLRYLPMSLFVMIPRFGSLLVTIETLFIFRKDKRCVHDMIAKTKVVNYIKR